jgi:nickel-dependent lactate racemase
MISEVAAENGIRVEPGDPLFALVTMNRMVFEEAAQMYYNHNQQLIVEFKESMKSAEMRAGSMLAQMVKESAEKMRKGLQGDIHIAGLKACEYVHEVNEAHRRPALARWVSVGLVAAAAIFASGVWIGPLLD